MGSMLVYITCPSLTQLLSLISGHWIGWEKLLCSTVFLSFRSYPAPMIQNDSIQENSTLLKILIFCKKENKMVLKVKVPLGHMFIPIVYKDGSQHLRKHCNHPSTAHTKDEHSALVRRWVLTLKKAVHVL